MAGVGLSIRRWGRVGRAGHRLSPGARGGGQEIGETRVNRQIGTADQRRDTGQSYPSGSAPSPARESSNTNSILPIQRQRRCNFQPYTTQVNLFEMPSAFAPFRERSLRRTVPAMRLTTASLSHATSGHTLIFLLGMPAPYCRLDADAC